MKNYNTNLTMVGIHMLGIKGPWIRAATLATAVGTASITPVAADEIDMPKEFRKCAPCHTANGGEGGLGPDLQGIIGRKPGYIENADGELVPNPKATDGLLEFGEENGVWTAEKIDELIENTRGTAPGIAMPFQGIPKPSEREAIVDYLKKISPSGP